MKEIINQLDFIKIKTSALKKPVPREWEDNPQIEKTFAKDKLTTPNPGEDMVQQELSFLASMNAKQYSHLGRQFGSLLQNQTNSYHKIQHSGFLEFT